MAQVLVNRFLYLRHTRPGLFKTLTALVRAYSQPVNPRWAKGGDLWQKAWARSGSERDRRALLAASRRRKRHQSRTEFSPDTLLAVSDALVGSTDIPPTVVHFAAPRVGGQGMTLLQSRPRTNWLYTVPGARHWQGYAAR